jgi:hypothetical protein
MSLFIPQLILVYRILGHGFSPLNSAFYLPTSADISGFTKKIPRDAQVSNCRLIITGGIACLMAPRLIVSENTPLSRPQGSISPLLPTPGKGQAGVRVERILRSGYPAGTVLFRKAS